ncbi:MAG: hypothetical protein AAGA26_00160 [Pseudomonadota bacterium]
MQAAEKQDDPKTAECAQDRGRRRVRRVLIEPMLAKGLVRPKSMTAGAFNDLQTRIADRFGWITDEIAEVLVDMAAREAGGVARNEFPAEERLNGWARDLAPAMGVTPPIDLPKKVTSYLASAAGRDAWNRAPDEAMALYRFLTTNPGIPATDRARAQILEWAHEYDRRFITASIKVEAGTASPDEHRWLAGYRERRALVHALVFPSTEAVA